MTWQEPGIPPVKTHLSYYCRVVVGLYSPVRRSDFLEVPEGGVINHLVKDCR